ncbi:uncharacterized protein LOC124453015 isoform X2 [Xenia sp. Carnegie-2017]|uniref:uncharacterized protein LOC124453015 isoform X2 n=1 Tax=Xenia sp. Carnegie-2017 TaxID=2897299 RepID=UPI001F046B76|nr:uncharacterized protein LOC124453015 isoform X2 [Xenia sp. Carnegie-2017]
MVNIDITSTCFCSPSPQTSVENIPGKRYRFNFIDKHADPCHAEDNKLYGRASPSEIHSVGFVDREDDKIFSNTRVFSVNNDEIDNNRSSDFNVTFSANRVADPVRNVSNNCEANQMTDSIQNETIDVKVLREPVDACGRKKFECDFVCGEMYPGDENKSRSQSSSFGSHENRRYSMDNHDSNFFEMMEGPDAQFSSPQEIAKYLFRKHFRSKRTNADGENSRPRSNQSAREESSSEYSSECSFNESMNCHQKQGCSPLQSKRTEVFNECNQARSSNPRLFSKTADDAVYLSSSAHENSSMTSLMKRPGVMRNANNSLTPRSCFNFDKRRVKSPEPVVAVHPCDIISDEVFVDGETATTSYEKYSTRRRSSPDITHLKSLHLHATTPVSSSRKLSLSRSKSYSNIVNEQTSNDEIPRRRSSSFKPIPSFEEFRSMRGINRMVSDRSKDGGLQDSRKNTVGDGEKTDLNNNSRSEIVNNTEETVNIQDLLLKYRIYKKSSSEQNESLNQQYNDKESLSNAVIDTKQRLLNILDDFLAVRTKHKASSMSCVTTKGNFPTEERRPSLPTTSISYKHVNRKRDYVISACKKKNNDVAFSQNADEISKKKDTARRRAAQIRSHGVSHCSMSKHESLSDRTISQNCSIDEDAKRRKHDEFRKMSVKTSTSRESLEVITKNGKIAKKQRRKSTYTIERQEKNGKQHEPNCSKNTSKDVPVKVDHTIESKQTNTEKTEMKYPKSMKQTNSLLSLTDDVEQEEMSNTSQGFYTLNGDDNSTNLHLGLSKAQANGEPRLLSRGSSFLSNSSTGSESVSVDFEESEDEDVIESRRVQKRPETDINRNDSGLGDEIEGRTRSKRQRKKIDHVGLRQPLLHRETNKAKEQTADMRQTIKCPDCERCFFVQKNRPSVKSHGPKKTLICYKCQKHRVERKEAIVELLETELNYGNDILIVKEEFLSPMQTGGIVSQENAAKIFLNIQELLSVSSKLCEKLEKNIKECREKDDEDLCDVNVGKIFIENMELLQAYEFYCSRQAKAMDILELLQKKNDVLRVFLNISFVAK